MVSLRIGWAWAVRVLATSADPIPIMRSNRIDTTIQSGLLRVERSLANVSLTTPIHCGYGAHTPGRLGRAAWFSPRPGVYRDGRAHSERRHRDGHGDVGGARPRAAPAPADHASQSRRHA